MWFHSVIPGPGSRSISTAFAGTEEEQTTPSTIDVEHKTRAEHDRFFRPAPATSERPQDYLDEEDEADLIRKVMINSALLGDLQQLAAASEAVSHPMWGLGFRVQIPREVPCDIEGKPLPAGTESMDTCNEFVVRYYEETFTTEVNETIKALYIYDILGSSSGTVSYWELRDN